MLGLRRVGVGSTWRAILYALIACCCIISMATSMFRLHVLEVFDQVSTSSTEEHLDISMNESHHVLRRSSEQKSRIDGDVVPKSVQKLLDALDPQKAENDLQSKSPPIPPYRGVLVDLPRNYIPLIALQQIIRYIAARNLTILHLRLADDQAFMLQLDNVMDATPTTVSGNVYTPSELRELNNYAIQHGIIIVPELTVPGHAGGWLGATTNQSTSFVVHCPREACRTAWSIPLDVSNPETVELVANVVQKVVDIFPTSPFIHLGGDEISNAKRCFQEARILSNRDSFEKGLRKRLKTITDKKIIRWEESKDYFPDLTHIWTSSGYPSYCRSTSNTNASPCILSRELYWDKGDISPWDAYSSTVKMLSTGQPYGIVACPWELDTGAWMERNIWGNLAAFAIAMKNTSLSKEQFQHEYKKECSALLAAEENSATREYPASVCYDPMPYNVFKKRFHWREGERDSLICTRMSNAGLPCRTPNCPFRGESPEVTKLLPFRDTSNLG